MVVGKVYNISVATYFVGNLWELSPTDFPRQYPCENSQRPVGKLVGDYLPTRVLHTERFRVKFVEKVLYPRIFSRILLWEINDFLVVFACS